MWLPFPLIISLYSTVFWLYKCLLIVILLLITLSPLNWTFFCGNNTYPVPPAGYKVLCGVWHVTPILLSKSLQSVKNRITKALLENGNNSFHLLAPTMVVVTAAFLWPVPGLVRLQRRVSKILCLKSKTTNITTKITSRNSSRNGRTENNCSSK